MSVSPPPILITWRLANRLYIIYLTTKVLSDEGALAKYPHLLYVCVLDEKKFRNNRYGSTFPYVPQSALGIDSKILQSTRSDFTGVI